MTATMTGKAKEEKLPEEAEVIRQDDSGFTFFTQTEIDEFVTPFPGNMIKQKEVKYTNKSGEEKVMVFDYVESADIIEKLNATVNHEWSFKVVSHMENKNEIVIHGAMRIGNTVHEAFGGSLIQNQSEGWSNAFKGAVSDTIKLCAKQFGIGLHLWQKSAPMGQVHNAVKNSVSATPSTVLASEAQRNYMKRLLGNLEEDSDIADELKRAMENEELTVPEASELIDNARNAPQKEG
jgi:hypothetical protein